MRVSTGSKPNADQKLDEFRRKTVVLYKSAGSRSGHVVPVSTFARGSHGEFNENTHALYTKRAMTSAKKVVIKNYALDDFGSFLVSDLVSPLVSKRKRPEA